uniref:NnrS family protein n=1 Tax=Ningiella ruwaisensis TaxID=2364274 RepID=UPI0010A0241D|nr:NnrS family protein [Ningiella ruwaisensis]
MINITDNAKEQKIMPFWRLGFRPFFLFGSAFAFIAIALWLLALKGVLSSSPFHSVIWWHSHEMLFGFTTAIIAGFLLTAVQNWTGIPGLKGKSLIFLFSVWLAARLLLLANLEIPVFIIALVDLVFLPLVAFFLARPVLRIKQYRNLVFVPLLLLMTIANIFTYLPAFGLSESFARQGFYAMVMLVTVVVALIGGRVIPMFTANGTQTQKVQPIRWVELSCIALLIAIAVGMLFSLNANILGALSVLAAAFHLFRSLYWRPWVTLKVPLVWSLHLSMFFIPLGLGLLALHYFTSLISLSAAIHSLTVGVIGGMIIAMMSRVSLGHTGRMLQTSSITVIAYVAIALAAISRSLLVWLVPAHITNLWVLSGLLWCLSFACFLWIYLPILISPRVDGRPG